MKWFFTILIFMVFFYGSLAQKNNYDQSIEDLTNKLYKHVYQHEDSTYYYLDKISKISKANSDYHTFLQTAIDYNRVAGYHNNFIKLNTNLVLVDSLFLVHKDFIDSSPKKLYYQNSLFYDKGMYYFGLDNFDKTRYFFNKIIKSTEALTEVQLNDDHKALLSVSYSFIAKIYTLEHKYDLAKQFYNRNIRFLISKKPNDKALLYRNYSLLAEVYKLEKKYRSSNNYFKSSLQYSLNNNDNQNRIVTVTSHIIDNYNNLLQVDSAYHYLEIMKTNLPNNHPFSYKYYESKGDIYQATNDYSKAEHDFKEALRLLTLSSNGLEHEKIALMYNKTGKLHARFNEPLKAVENFNLGIKQLTNNKSNKTTLFKILKNKATVLTILSSDNQYAETINTVDLGIGTLDSLKPTFKSESDKLLLIEDAFPLFEAGLEAVYNSYAANNNNKELIDKAFLYAEKSKSVLLLEALLSAKASSFGTIPDELLEKEKQLKAQIIFLEKQVNAGKSSSLIEDGLFRTKNEYRKLVSSIETNYQSYYDLKYNTEVISLSKAQKLLSNDEILVSYFYGNRNIYVITITNNSKDIKQIKIDADLEPQIRNIYQKLSNPKSDLAELAKESNVLYKKILEPSITIHPNKKILIVIADGLLNYIPFSSLNTSSNGIEYLIRQKSISYANSATLLSQLRQRKQNNNAVLAFAPNFSNTSNTINELSEKLLPLPNNTKEIEQILTTFKGNSYFNEEATLQNFTSEISKFGIVHLATHAIFDDENPEYSYLAFTPTANNDNLLYVSDLYNIQLDVNLVTLSACESGIGNLKRGEGFMSLARSFFYSGASSISSTLWKINDASSTQLMDDFYKQLSKGNSKDKALQNAKLRFIERNNQNALVHPYYWSGFIISGSTVPIVVSHNYWLWSIVGLLVLLIIGFLAYRRTKS